MKTEWNDLEGDATLTLIADASDAGLRLDRFVSDKGGLSRSAAVKLIEEGSVTLSGGAANKNYRMREGDCVEVTLPEPEPMEAIPQNIPIDVVYEDDDLIVVNKPVGMVVHPAAGNPDGTLVNALLYHCGGSLSGVGGVIRPGIVHRIDKDTSGLLVVAKNDRTHLALSEMLKGHHINRIYTAVAVGNFREDAGTVDAPIGRHPVDRKKMAVIRNPEMRAREAVTHWSVIARGEADGNAFTLLRCELETGRTHQIRVHMSATGHPLLGDTLYGGGNTKFEARHRSLIKGQCLHAGELIFTHPRTGEVLHLHAPMPKEMQSVVEKLFEGTPV
ncbi:MAG: RluA family pseudouridine synthase [Clostridia bacterium]|nr:RluA family pseudouridine synthase [Clostridia bacterium]